MRKMLIAIAIAAALAGTAASARPPPWKQQGFASADACFKYADAHPSADGGRNCTFKDEIDFICSGARILAHLKECARHMDLCATLREYSKMAQTDRDEDYRTDMANAVVHFCHGRITQGLGNRRPPSGQGFGGNGGGAFGGSGGPGYSGPAF
jgi:hypothetical protein